MKTLRTAAQSLRQIIFPKFADPDEERTFSHLFVRGGLANFLLSLVMGITVTTTLIILDLANRHQTQIFSLAQVSRSGILLLLAVLIWSVRRRKSFLAQHYSAILASFLVLIFALANFASLNQHGANSEGTLFGALTFNYGLIVMVGYAFYRMSIFVTTTIAVTGFLFGLYVALSTAMDAQLIARFCVYVISFNVLGSMVRIATENRERKLFAETMALEKARAELAASFTQEEERARQRAELLSAVGHDLRQPMMAVYAQLGVLRATASNASARTTESIDLIARCIDDMDQRLSQVSHLARLQRVDQPAQLERIDLAAILLRLKHVFEARAAHESVRLYVTRLESNSLMAMSAAQELFEVLSQLTDNAIKYANPQRRIRRVALHVKALASTVRITVRDNGVGIAPNLLPTLSVPYVAGARWKGGLGLGLSLAHAAVRRLQHHRMTLSSVEGKGTAATVTIPRWEGHSAPLQLDAVASTTQEAVRFGQGKTVLLVDDTEAVRTSVAALLETWGFAVLQAPDPHTAKVLLDSCEVTLAAVIADFQLGVETSGMDVIRAVRLHEGAPTPAILYSGNEAALLTLSTGADAAVVLRKPLSPERLRAELERFVNAHRASD